MSSPKFSFHSPKIFSYSLTFSEMSALVPLYPLINLLLLDGYGNTHTAYLYYVSKGFILETLRH